MPAESADWTEQASVEVLAAEAEEEPRPALDIVVDNNHVEAQKYKLYVGLDEEQEPFGVVPVYSADKTHA